MACEDIILVGYAGLVISVEIFIVGDYFCEVGDGVLAFSGVIFVFVTVRKDWVSELSIQFSVAETPAMRGGWTQPHMEP